MAEHLYINPSKNREHRYQDLLPQIKAIIDTECNHIAVLANCCAAIRQTFGFFWVGFYLVDNEKELVLGPFQGDIACTRIPFGKGVCGTAWKKRQTIIVNDVEAFPGHIACSSLSKSEIVVPIKAQGDVVAVLDVDSDQYADFSEVDQRYLEQLCAELSVLWDKITATNPV